MNRVVILVLASVAVGLVLQGCNPPSAAPTPTPAANDTPSPAPTDTPDPGPTLDAMAKFRDAIRRDLGMNFSDDDRLLGFGGFGQGISSELSRYAADLVGRIQPVQDPFPAVPGAGEITGEIVVQEEALLFALDAPPEGEEAGAGRFFETRWRIEFRQSFSFDEPRARELSKVGLKVVAGDYRVAYVLSIGVLIRVDDDAGCAVAKPRANIELLGEPVVPPGAEGVPIIIPRLESLNPSDPLVLPCAAILTTPEPTGTPDATPIPTRPPPTPTDTPAATDMPTQTLLATPTGTQAKLGTPTATGTPQATETPAPEPTPTNTPPHRLVADAGQDQVVIDRNDGLADVALDGSGSRGDAPLVRYRWLLGGMDMADGVAPTITLAVGEHIVTLEVMDATGATAIDTVTIAVEFTM